MSLRMEFINNLLLKGNQQGFFVYFEDKLTKKIYHNDIPRTEECPDATETIFVNNKTDFMKHLNEIFRLKALNLNLNEPYTKNVPPDNKMYEDFTANYDSDRDSFETKISEYLSSKENDENIDSRAYILDNTEGCFTGVNGRFPSRINIVKRPESGKSFKNVDFDQSYVINSNFDFVNENDLYGNMINCEKTTLPICDDPDALEIVSNINERIHSMNDVSHQYQLTEYDVQNLSDLQPITFYRMQENNLKENIYSSYDPLPESSITHPNPNDISNFDYSDSERNISKHMNSTRRSFSNKNNKKLKSTSTVQGSDSESKENPHIHNKNDPNNIDDSLYRKASSISDLHYKDSERSILKDTSNEKQIIESMKHESAISSHLNKSPHSVDNRLNSIPSNISYAMEPYEHLSSAQYSLNTLSNVEYHDSDRQALTNIIPNKLEIKQSKQFDLIIFSDRQHSQEYQLNNTKESDVKTINRNIVSTVQYNDPDRQTMKNRVPNNLEIQQSKQFDLITLSDRPSFQEYNLKDIRESDIKTQNRSTISNVQYLDSNRQTMTNMVPNNLEIQQSKQFDLITLSDRPSFQECNLKDKTESDIKTKRGSDVSTEIEFLSTQSQIKSSNLADNSARNIVKTRDNSDQCCEITTEPDESLNVLGCGEKETNIQSFNTKKTLIHSLLKETTQNVPHDSISIKKSLKQQDPQNKGEGSLRNQQVMINKSVYVKYDTKDDQVYNSCSKRCSKKCIYGVEQCIYNLQKLFQ